MRGLARLIVVHSVVATSIAIGTAWAMVVVGSADHDEYEATFVADLDVDGGLWLVRRYDSFGMTQVSSVFFPKRMMDAIGHHGVESWYDEGDPFDVFPLWSRGGGLEDLLNPGEKVIVAVGWPFRSLKCEYVQPLDSKEFAISGGIALNSERLGVQRALPYEPILAGLLANVAAMMVVSIACECAARGLRTVYRRRRGCCVACGYELRGRPETEQHGCPECGCNRTDQTSSSELSSAVVRR